jgi:hypothetical protein
VNGRQKGVAKAKNRKKKKSKKGMLLIIDILDDDIKKGNHKIKNEE